MRQSLKDTPVELPTAIEAIETDQEYYDMQETKAQAEQTVDYWLKKANYLNTISLVFALVANLILLTLPLLTRLAPLKSLITLYINICKITFFPSTQYAYIYDSIFLCKLCYKDKLGQTYINMHIEWKEKM